MLNGKSIMWRVARLDECIARLKSEQGISLKAYQTDPRVQGFVERSFQVAIECCTDIAGHVVAGLGLERPADRKGLFRILGEAGYLDPELAAAMVQLAQLRNRLVHLYWDIDPERMHHYLHHDVVFLERFRAFALGLLEAQLEQSGDEGNGY